MTKHVLTFCVILALLNMPVNAAWIAVQGRQQLPQNAVLAGQGSNGEPLYVCRAEYGGGVHPGTLAGTAAYCSITFNEKEYMVKNYEILIEEDYSWASAYNGDIPFDALPAGKDQQGNVFFICRGELNSEWRPGKIRHTYLGCSIPHNGNEIEVFWYQVMVGSSTKSDVSSGNVAR